uniref:Zinc finger protein 34-like n=1 Tax=Labrus bergylta TaxID=56723 RepID=A0A3Q3GJE0_9LABR|nr:zinc finger protein 34-like [Labrus bergylta]
MHILIAKLFNKEQREEKGRHRSTATDAVSRQPAVMSIEYTIDIQLTELGFPTDTLHVRDTSVGEAPIRSTSSNESLPPGHPPITRSTTLKQRLLVTGHQSYDGTDAGSVKQTSSFEQNAVDLIPPVLNLTPAQNAQAEEDGGLPEQPVSPSDHLHSGPEQPITDQNHSKQQVVDNGKPEGLTEEQQDEENDSDSDVSEVCEEEEDEEEEDELNSDTSQSGDFSCSVCGLQLTSKFKLQDHMNLHTGARPYCCAECGKRFCQISSYRAHLRTHAQTRAESFQCRICRKGFSHQEDLKHHLAINHFQDQYYECDLCKRVFASLEACAYHVKQRACMQKIGCDLCGRSFSSTKQLVRHRKKTCNRNFRCTDCKESFTKKNALLKHSFSHLGLLPYTCVRCRCHFRLAKLYLQHKCEPERIHCVACLREFLSQKDFEQHKKDTGCWGNQEPKGDQIRCLQCGQRFDTSEELKQHAGAHQRVLKCAECGKGFRSALLLMSHMGGHAGNSPCLCQSCGLGFPHQQNYDSHLKTCGQAPQPKSSAKKRPAPESSSSETTMPETVNSNPHSPTPFQEGEKKLMKRRTSRPKSSGRKTTRATADVSESFFASVQVSHNPGLVLEGVSAGSNTTDGLWKLTLDKPLLPAAELVLLLPVCATPTDGLPLPSSETQTPPAPAVIVQPQVAFPLVSNEHMAVGAIGKPLNAPMDLFKEIKKFPNYVAPFDLSKKSALSAVPLLSVKNEPEESNISAEAYSFQGCALKNIKNDTYTDVKNCKMDPLDLSTSTGLIMDIKKET